MANGYGGFLGKPGLSKGLGSGALRFKTSILFVPKLF